MGSAEYEVLQEAADRLGMLIGTRLGIMADGRGYVVTGCTGSQVGVAVGSTKSFTKLLELLHFAIAVAEDAETAGRRGRKEWPGRICEPKRP